MSLVGSEVDVNFDTSLLTRVVSDDDELSVPRNHQVDQHPPPSPPRPAEMLFMSNLETQNISAAALAQQIHRTHRYSANWTGTSVATDDFATAVGWQAGDDDSYGTPNRLPVSARSTTDTLTRPFADDSYSSDYDESDYHIFQRDVLSRNFSATEKEDIFQDSNMATATVNIPKTTTTSPAGKKLFSTEAPTHVDAAEHVYDSAKGIWAWGKGVMVVKPFLGIAEGVAGKFVSLTGSSLESLDGAVIDQLHGLDDKVLNPAIQAIVGTILQAASKSEDILKPIIFAILKPLGLIKDEAENPELTTVKGVTVQ